MLRLTRGDTVDWKFQRKYCDGTVITQAPTNMTFTMRLSPDGVGKVGTLYACVESGTGKLYICTSADDVTPSYVWTNLV